MSQDLGTIETNPIEGRVREGVAVHELDPFVMDIYSLVIPRQLLGKEVPCSCRPSNLGQLTRVSNWIISYVQDVARTPAYRYQEGQRYQT